MKHRIIFLYKKADEKNFVSEKAKLYSPFVVCVSVQVRFLCVQIVRIMKLQITEYVTWNRNA